METRQASGAAGASLRAGPHGLATSMSRPAPGARSAQALLSRGSLNRPWASRDATMASSSKLSQSSSSLPPRLTSAAASGHQPRPTGAQQRPASASQSARLHPSTAQNPLASSQTRPTAGSNAKGNLRIQGNSAVRLSQYPHEWTSEDIRDQCSQYGTVEKVNTNGVGRFVVLFSTRDIATQAIKALQGLQVANSSGGFNVVQCEHIRAPSTAVEAPFRSEHQPDIFLSALEDGIPIEVLYVDELVSTSGIPAPSDVEVFLCNLPFQDYTVSELQQWLEDFGDIEDIAFLRDFTSQEFTGSGYVRFWNHADALALVKLFPAQRKPGELHASWSLSERLHREHLTSNGSTIAPVIRRVRQLRAHLKCPSLTLFGDGLETGWLLGKSDLGVGPLHFAWISSDCDGNREALNEQLERALDQACNAPKATNRRVLGTGSGPASSSSQPAPVLSAQRQGVAAPQRGPPAPVAENERGEEAPAPFILVRGFPGSWTQQQVRLLFTVYGGVATVSIFESQGARLAYVKLRDVENTSKAAEQLNDTQVGDGEVMEKCVISCDILGSTGFAGKTSVRTGWKAPSADASPRSTDVAPLKRLAPPAAPAAPSKRPRSDGAEGGGDTDKAQDRPRLARKAAPPNKTKRDVPSGYGPELVKARATVREAQDAMGRKEFKFAVDKYVQALQTHLELSEAHPEATVLRSEITKLFEEAEDAKRRLQAADRHDPGQRAGARENGVHRTGHGRDHHRHSLPSRRRGASEGNGHRKRRSRSARGSAPDAYREGPEKDRCSRVDPGRMSSVKRTNSSRKGPNRKSRGRSKDRSPLRLEPARPKPVTRKAPAPRIRLRPRGVAGPSTVSRAQRK